MSDYPGLQSVGTAEALLSDLRQVKDDFRAIDSAVANHLRDGRERVEPNLVPAFIGGAISSGVGALAASAVTALTGFDTGLTAVSRVEWVDLFMISGAMSGFYLSALPGVKRAHAINASHAQRGEDFLLAGVAVELTLGDLSTALDDARRGRPGSAEALAEQSAQARQAFEHYASALRTLNEDDVSIRFPWSTRDIDVTEARELLAVNADAVLAQAGFAAGAEAESGLLGQLPKAIAAQSSTGGLAPIVRSSTALQEDLAATGRNLKAVESTIHQAARATTNGTAGQELRALADVVAEAYLRSGFLEADCASIKSAASSAGNADTQQEAFGHLKAAPSTATVRESFEKYASGVHQAESKLGKRPDQSLDTAAAAVRKALRDLPRLKITENDLVTAMDAELERAGQPAS